MFTNLDVFQTSFAMARHSGTRQAITAANLANADTPNYRARALGSFAESYQEPSVQGMRATRERHLGTAGASSSAMVHFSDAESSPNGNSVSLEQEMLNAVEIQREHSRALAIYKHSMDVLRTTIGRR